MLSILATSIFLGGCGEKTPDAPSGEASSPASSNPKLASGWTKPDACAVVDDATFAAIAGMPVSASELRMAHPADGVTAATSECVFTLQDGGRYSLMLRWSPINDNTEGAINTMRSGLAEVMKALGGTVEDVPKLGKAAFWVSRTSSLNVFIGEDRLAIINMPSGAGAKDKAITLAHKLID
jgi:hypothetical protein